VVKIHIDIIRAIVNLVMVSGTAELGCTIVLELVYSPVVAGEAGSSDLPYSGGAHGPSPFATRFEISSYHCSFVRPCKSPMMVMVMLSHPTPPVSLFEARQLSIMFSQIAARSCFATIPRLTNSITAWEDWTSQIPVPVSGGLSIYGSTVGPTVTCNNKELVVGSDFVDLNVGEGSDNLLLRREVGALLELEVTYRAGEGEVAVDTAKVNEAAGSLDTGLLGCALLAGYNVSFANRND
jgi:hypothetical protein